jgi:hypothetical protein
MNSSKKVQMPQDWPTVPNDGRSMAQHFFVDGIAECTICEAVGKVKRSEQPGCGDRIITWKRKGNSKPYAEIYPWASVATSCDKCWQEYKEEKERNRKEWKKREEKKSFRRAKTKKSATPS